MKPKWNEQQLEAIQGRGGTMLVSAAAGSGKTAVLVERIMQRLCDEKDPCSIDEFLVVTFTRAATAQMKSKISAELSEKIAENPENRALRKNRFLLPYSNIETIDSFCINLVRNSFSALNISPDFEILDGAKADLIGNEALSSVIEKLHREKSDEFRALNDALTNGNDDQETEKAILQLYSYSRGYEFPDDKTQELYADYATELPFAQSIWGRQLMNDAKDFIAEAIDKIDKCLELTDGSETLKKYRETMKSERDSFAQILNSFDSYTQEQLKNKLEEMSFPTVNAREDEYRELCKSVRNSYKSPLKGSLSFLTVSEETYQLQRKKTVPIVKTLIDAVREYSKELLELKNEANAYTFDDILHFALELLVKQENGKTVRTDFAIETGKKYKEISVDEYQDVSKAQDTIFWALSDNDTNRFMVGDVKQSIYGFRQAMPEVFTHLRSEMQPYDGKTYPARVTLNNNYRSRRDVTDTVNFIFSRLMTKDIGDVDYNEDECLNPAAKYEPDDEIKIEFDYFGSDEISSKEQTKLQAEFTAKKINDAVKNGLKITSKINSDGTNEMRGAKYGDFCILYRSAACVKAFEQAFDELGIPYIAGTDDNFISTPEIGFLKALLKIIDNPANDVPLITVMLSPAFGFTPDDLAQIRYNGEKSEKFYNCIVRESKNGNKKADDFLSKLAQLRRIASTLPAGEFSARIIDETGYRAIVSKMKNGESRLANLNAFISLAESYEKNGVKGISGFVRFLDRVSDGSVGTSIKSKTDSADAVSLMTIHKSKGLEFPIVYLVNTEKPYNEKELNANILLSKHCGLGIKYVEDGIRHDTIFHYAAGRDKKREQSSEEMRLMYVALTRAKERLVILASRTKKLNIAKKLPPLLAIDKKPSISSALELNSFAYNLVYALAVHPDAHSLRDVLNIGGTHKKCDTKINFNVYDYTEIEKEISDETTESVKTEIKADEKMLAEIKERLAYVYPYEQLNAVTAKSVASKPLDGEFNEEYFASASPSFTFTDHLTPSQRGTATHRFMQYCDFKRAPENIKSEILRLVDSGMLTETEADIISVNKVAFFFKSPLFKRIMTSEKLYKEYAFSALMPVSTVYPEIDKNITQDETIVMQGVVDLAFEEDNKIVIVDFKTDYATAPEELLKKYSSQLNTYRECLSKVLDKKVKEAVIYSFSLGQTIVIE